MIIANRLKTSSRAEYLLYLWQVEDTLRAYGCDFERLREGYLSRFDVTANVRREMERWYADLCEMMHSEGKTERGHLQISQNVLQELVELHNWLVDSEKFPYYREMYYKVLPYVVELRAKGGHHDETELQTCFDALYGVMMLRVKGVKISTATETAVRDIATLLGQLSDYYFKDKEEPIMSC